MLQVGPLRDDGRHEICSLFASLDLADRVTVTVASGGEDAVVCPGVPEPNLATAALSAFRRATGARLPSLRVAIDKRIPVAAGLGGGSADAAAVLRAANALAGRPLDGDGLRRLSAGLGSDIPSQIEPRHALVTGAGEVVEPVALPPMAIVLMPQAEGLSTGAVYAEADRLGAPRTRLDPGALRRLAASGRDRLVAALDNDLQQAALSLRPELAQGLAALRAAGAEGALVTGSGPTVVGVFADRADAERAAGTLPEAIVTQLRAVL